MKMITLIILGLLSLIVVTIVSAYTAPDSDNVNLVLDIGYTAPDSHNVHLVLGDVITDTCSCPGLNNDWEVDHSDYCNLGDCDLGTGKLTFIGSGETSCTGHIITSDLGDPNTGNILWLNNSNCNIEVSS